MTSSLSSSVRTGDTALLPANMASGLFWSSWLEQTFRMTSSQWVVDPRQFLSLAVSSEFCGASDNKSRLWVLEMAIDTVLIHTCRRVRKANRADLTG